MEQLKSFLRHTPATLVKMMKNTELWGRNTIHFYEKYIGFRENPELLEKEISLLKRKIEENEARISIIKLCLKVK